MENTRPEFDALLSEIAHYVHEVQDHSEEAFKTARYALLDAIGCGLLALKHPKCAALLGPWIPGTVVPQGVRVPGTSYQLDPIKAAFDIGVMNRWLDFNDTWLAAEWGHPSDNLGALLAVCDRRSFKMRDLLAAMIKAYEIQGILALENSFNQVGLDHVILVKVASSVLANYLLGGDLASSKAVLSQAFIDGHSLRTYRHAPNTGSRKSWAAGDATSRGLQLALMTQRGEQGYPSALTATQWGFEAVLFKGKNLVLGRELGSYVMENILFKIAYPAEFHGQSAVEAAIELAPLVAEKFEKIEKINIYTQASAMRIINKSGMLYNPADRDHCLQYMVAVALLYGHVDDLSYSDEIAADPRIDSLRAKMYLAEDLQYSKDYLDPNKRSIANRIEIIFKDQSSPSLNKELHYPLGHRARRAEGIPLLLAKFKKHIEGHYPRSQSQAILNLCLDEGRLLNTPVSEFLDLLSSSGG